MLNLLITHRSSEHLREIANYIAKNLPDVRIAGITSNGNEALSILKNQNIDISIIDYDLPLKSKCKVTYFILNIKKELKHNSIFVLSPDKILKNPQKLLLCPYINKVVPSNTDLPTIKKFLENHIDDLLAKMDKEKHEENIFRDKVINELNQIGYNLCHVGTHYLVDTLLYIRARNYNTQNLTQNIYPSVCKKNGKDINNVKCNINIATDAVYKNVNNLNLQKYFNLDGTVKPTTKMVIYAILQRVRGA